MFCVCVQGSELISLLLSSVMALKVTVGLIMRMRGQNLEYVTISK